MGTIILTPLFGSIYDKIGKGATLMLIGSIMYPELKIVFTGSSVMRLKDENPELNGIVKSYNLRGFSFREFINLQTGNNFRPYSLDEILHNHEHIIKQILPKVSPAKFFHDYIHHEIPYRMLRARLSGLQ